jgi:hypothetical protein
MNIKELKQKYLNKIIKYTNPEFDEYGTYYYIQEIYKANKSDQYDSIMLSCLAVETTQPEDTKGVSHKKQQVFGNSLLIIFLKTRYGDPMSGKKSFSDPLNVFPGVISFTQEVEIIDPSSQVKYQFITGLFCK